MFWGRGLHCNTYQTSDQIVGTFEMWALVLMMVKSFSSSFNKSTSNVNVRMSV